MYKYAPNDDLISSLNNTYSRPLAEAISLSLVHLLISVISIFSNVSVIISAILERWKEIDNFTFVFSISLAFNHVFLGFFVYPVTAFSVISNKWRLGKMWCWSFGLTSSYLNTVYVLHIVVLMLDMIIVKYSDIRTKIAVSLSKRIALTTWGISFIPQIYPFFFKMESDSFGYDPLRGGCFERFIFQSWVSLLKTLCAYIIMPLTIIGLYYIMLLFQEEARRRLDVTINKSVANHGVMICRNYKTALGLTILYFVSMVPHVTIGIISFASPTTFLPHRLLEFDVLWLELSSCIVPVCYLYTCPTFLNIMAKTKPCFLLRKFERQITPTYPCNNIHCKSHYKKAEAKTALRSMPTITIDPADSLSKKNKIGVALAMSVVDVKIDQYEYNDDQRDDNEGDGEEQEVFTDELSRGSRASFYKARDRQGSDTSSSMHLSVMGHDSVSPPLTPRLGLDITNMYKQKNRLVAGTLADGDDTSTCTFSISECP